MDGGERSSTSDDLSSSLLDKESSEDDLRSPAKRLCLAESKMRDEKLEDRLGGILCCAVCLDLPKLAVYQCFNGHLMCAGCFTHVLADARLKDEVATCPSCRREITRPTASRNLAVEKAISELPAECQFCNEKFPRHTLKDHEENFCIERRVQCKYSRIGCPWQGPCHEANQHERVCSHPHRSGGEILEVLKLFDHKYDQQNMLHDYIFDLLSFEKIVFSDLQMKPYRTDEFIHKLYYETSRFSSFNNQWAVKALINSDQRDPASSTQRLFSYQLMLKSKNNLPMSIHFMVLPGPFGDMKVNPQVHKFEFSEAECESPFFTLPLVDSAESNRLLSSKVINFRLIMFLE